YNGWQRQANGRSVQGEIETALEKLSGEAPVVRGAGRTDAGVHALGQVAHFDLSRAFEPDIVRDGLNAHLRDEEIVICQAMAVDDDFDARFSAIARHYRYRILSRRAPSAIDRKRVWHVARPIDIGAMRNGAAMLVGHHDFTTFRSTECQAKSPIKTLDRLDITQHGQEVVVEASARSFLHSQVRSIVGTLARVGIGAWSADRVATALSARDRAQCGPLAPPHGLYLTAVDY
ncbi:MAG: tRNA pseudouridine(38-40) synthase TruA, partial [Alphaproteobacteria bacterium]